MRNWVKRYKVSNLSKVDTSQYLDGDVFYTNQTIGILHNGKVRTVKTPDVSDFVTDSEVDNKIKNNLSDVPTKDEVQQMIDNATNEGGGQ